MSSLRLIVPPALWQMGSTLKRRLVHSTTFFEYAPDGWNTPLPGRTGNIPFWGAFIAQQEIDVAKLIARVRAGDPILDPTGDRNHAIFGYVVAVATRTQPSLSVLDYGGNLGDHYWIARALVPNVQLEYHCKELPMSVEAGRRMTPDVTWHADDGCFERDYDLVMFSGSIQYLRDWQPVVARAIAATRKYLFLADVPVVCGTPAYVATHRSRGHTALEHEMNRGEIIGTVERAGLRLVREFPMGPHPLIVNAPEQPTCVGWLFERP